MSLRNIGPIVELSPWHKKCWRARQFLIDRIGPDDPHWVSLVMTMSHSQAYRAACRLEQEIEDHTLDFKLEHIRRNYVIDNQPPLF